jgi:hypothetical protein
MGLGVLAGLLLTAGPARSGGPALSEELAAVGRALDKYQDPVIAIRDGYFSTLGCVEYPTGGMGIHFLNPALVGPVPDPMRPPVLLYEPHGDTLRLVGAEWFIPLATGVKGRPSLFGQPFDGPMEGHYPLQPKELHHYDLHVWLFRANPAGMFKSSNPDVRCPPGAQTFKLEPPQLVPHR